jgi:hypothetical protein
MSNYTIIISPETIQRDLTTIQYQGQSVGVYSAMTQILTGNTNGTSLLTGLTIPILITEDINDVGYYDPFDGEITQQDVVTNFLFSATTQNPYTVNVYNTSEQYQKFLDLSSYTVEWGDGVVETIRNVAPNYISHTYPTQSGSYEITLSQKNPWGDIKVTKTINLPYREVVASNQKGTAYFTSNVGAWSATPISYDYIFSGDSNQKLESQFSSNYIGVPYTVSGQSNSQLESLEQYGSEQYVLGKPIYLNRQYFGMVTDINPVFTAYTIQNIDYYDYSDGSTIFFMQSSGFTEFNLSSNPMTKQEVLMGVIDQPQIQTNVYIERGKNSAYERIQRLGEVDNLGDMENYGYGFFNVVRKD